MNCLIDQAEAERNRVSRRASLSWEEDSEMKALEYVDSSCISYERESLRQCYIWEQVKFDLLLIF